MRSFLIGAVVSGAVVFGVVPSADQREPGPGVTRLAVIQAEDARAATPDQLQVLTATATAASSPLQATAVRALGRLERPDLTATLVPLLDAQASRVRAEAANALAQSAGADPAAVRTAREGLMARLVGERDAEVRGAIAEALGRLPIPSPAIAVDTEKALLDVGSRVEITRRVERSAAGGRIVGLTLAPTKVVAVPMPALLGALRGLESFARGRARAGQSLMPETIDRLKTLVVAGARSASRVRLLALLCLLPVNGVDADLASRAQDDPDMQVRRLAVTSEAASLATLGRAMKDPAWLVRYEALLRYGRRFQATEGCEPVTGAIGATADHVSLLAVDLLSNPCRPEDKAIEMLLDLAAGEGQAQWRRPAHAMVALARAAPERARPMLARFLRASQWQSRMYAAHAAGRLGDVNALRQIAGDANDNVREAAIAELSKTAKHDADAIYIKALAASDFQLVMAAAGALAGSPDRETAVPALVSTLARLTALDSDSSRDPRVAVLDRLNELGSPDQAGVLKPYLNDADPRVASQAAKVLTAWTGGVVVAMPRPRPAPAASLTGADLERLTRTTVRVTMAGGGQFEVRLLVDLAPMSCMRFAALVAGGYYNGLTFHRVLPNFLIQGGSPGANEFVGHSRYMRDEVGRPSQLRGTLGTSTRGRDTGDAQFYINLVDTPRLDHDYTIFGEVTHGMDVVDRILEGDVMQKVELVPGRKPR
jgi:cyclophilin family peptidyl-prolyl cis-trans isomerase/HEAT repeat protein